MRLAAPQDPLVGSVVCESTRFTGAYKLIACPPENLQLLQQIPGVFHRRDPRRPQDAGWYVPRSLWEMGRRPANLLDYPEEEVKRCPKSGLYLKSHQLRAVSFLRAITREREGGILAADAGTGKQQPVDMRVSTPNGWREIGKLAIGDYVSGSDGLAKRVVGVFPQGIRPSFRVTFSDGSSTEAGPEHLWILAYRTSRSKPYRWRELELTTSQLLERPTIVYEGLNGQTYSLDLGKTPLYLPLLSGPIEYDADPLPIPPYTVGQLIANGSLAHGTPVLCSGAKDWPELLEHLHAEGVNPSSVRTYGSAVHATFAGLLPTIRELGLAVLSREKRIPKCYLYGRAVDRLALLRGLMDGDGSISAVGCKIAYYTISHGLAEDVRELVQGIGGIASIRVCDRRHDEKPIEYSVRLRLPAGLCPFTITRKAKRFRPRSHSLPVRRLTCVEYARDVESVCIEVDTQDKLYVTDDCILTHNTVAALHALYLDGYLEQPGLICGPLTARLVWCGERSDPFVHYGLDVQLLEGVKNLDPELLHQHKWFFIHYDIIHAWQPWLFAVLKPKAIIFDESHYLMNRKSRRGKAARDVSFCNTIDRRYCLTGTPIPNARLELWQQLSTAQPRQWGLNSAHDFGVRYCQGQRKEGMGIESGGFWEYKGESNTLELRARLAGTLLRYTREEIADELPKVKRHVIPVEDADPAVLEEYSFAQRDVKNYIKSKKQVSAEVQASIDALKKDSELAGELTTNKKGEPLQLLLIGSLIGILSRAKREAALKLVIKALEDHNHVALFSWRVETCNWLHQKLSAMAASMRIARKQVEVFGPAHYHIPIEKRIELAIQFAQAPTGIYVATRGAVGVAINELNAADCGILVDLAWNPAQLVQLESRVVREGNPHAEIDMYFLVMRGTIDDHIISLLEGKAQQALSVANGDAVGLALARDLAPASAVWDGQSSLDALCMRLMDD